MFLDALVLVLVFPEVSVYSLKKAVCCHQLGVLGFLSQLESNQMIAGKTQNIFLQCGNAASTLI